MSTPTRPVAPATAQVADYPILRFFAWRHLPEHLQQVSRPFGALAATLAATLPRGAETTVALRKLLESKDAAVRAALDTQGDA